MKMAVLLCCMVCANAFTVPVSLLAKTFAVRSAALRDNVNVESSTARQAQLTMSDSIPSSSSVSRRDAGALIAALALFAGSAPVKAKPTKASAEDTIAAHKKLLSVMEQLNGADELVTKQDWKAISKLMESPDFKDVENTLLLLINGPVLNADDKKTIGTRKRYGIAADVIYGVGGVQGAIEAIDNPQLQSCSSGVCSGDFVDASKEVPKSWKSLKASLSEILNICKTYKEFK